VSGTLGRSGAALGLFERGDHERANRLFRFSPRVVPGLAISSHATAMIDSSDGLARSVHQLAAASDCGFALSTPLPVDDAVDDVAADAAEGRELGLFFGEDFELVFTLPPERISTVRDVCDVPVTRVGTVTEAAAGVTLDGEALPDRGYTHGNVE
jgi:thiamine-monophosphate kinase